jgi:hypothetical protein
MNEKIYQVEYSIHMHFRNNLENMCRHRYFQKLHKYHHYGMDWHRTVLKISIRNTKNDLLIGLTINTCYIFTVCSSIWIWTCTIVCKWTLITYTTILTWCCSTTLKMTGIIDRKESSIDGSYQY